MKKATSADFSMTIKSTYIKKKDKELSNNPDFCKYTCLPTYGTD